MPCPHRVSRCKLSQRLVRIVSCHRFLTNKLLPSSVCAYDCLAVIEDMFASELYEETTDLVYPLVVFQGSERYNVFKHVYCSFPFIIDKVLRSRYEMFGSLIGVAGHRTTQAIGL